MTRGSSGLRREGQGQETAQCGSSQNKGRLPDHKDGECGRKCRGSWEEEEKCHKVVKLNIYAYAQLDSMTFILPHSALWEKHLG